MPYRDLYQNYYSTPCRRLRIPLPEPVFISVPLASAYEWKARARWKNTILGCFAIREKRVHGMVNILLANAASHSCPGIRQANAGRSSMKKRQRIEIA